MASASQSLRRRVASPDEELPRIEIVQRGQEPGSVGGAGVRACGFTRRLVGCGCWRRDAAATRSRDDCATLAAAAVRRMPRLRAGPRHHDAIGAPSTVSARCPLRFETGRDGARRSGVMNRLKPKSAIGNASEPRHFGGYAEMKCAVPCSRLASCSECAPEVSPRQ